MSVYSGFSTRSQEAQYYKLVEGLISLLQAKALLCLKHFPRPDDNSWLQKFNSTYSSMKNLELHKYLEPKLSESCRELAGHYSMDLPLDPIFSDFSYSKFTPMKLENSNKVINSPRKKQTITKGRNKSEKGRDGKGKLGMSQYYGKIMDNFLGKKETASTKKRNRSKPGISLDTQDFWLLDDKIKVIDNEYEY